MEILVFLVLIVAGVIWSVAYKSGKREGSRKGYGVGYSRGKRHRPSGGCLIVIVAVSVSVFALTKAIAMVLK